MTRRAACADAPATERGLVRLAQQLVVCSVAVSVGVDGPEAGDVAAALGTGGLPAVVARRRRAEVGRRRRARWRATVATVDGGSLLRVQRSRHAPA